MKGAALFNQSHGRMRRAALTGAMLLGAALLTACQSSAESDELLVLKAQGSFAVGGSSRLHEGTFKEDDFLSPDGQRAYGDHGYVFYQIPAEVKHAALIFQHGGAQTKRTWETTPDGREGFQNIFLKKGFPVYLVDEPHMGEAGLSTTAEDGTNPWAGNPLYADHTMHLLCRLGPFETLFPGSQFPPGEDSLEAFQRSWNPYSANLDNDLNAKVLAELTDKIGGAVLITHSMGGTIGWRTPFYSAGVKAIVSLEPGGTPFIFPEGESPSIEPAVFAPLTASALEVPLERFKELTKMPILLIYGDYIAEKPSSEVGPDKWRTELEMARAFTAAVNRHGGRAELIHLPDLGIRGNTHFLMQELNNEEIADLIEDWLIRQGL